MTQCTRVYLKNSNAVSQVSQCTNEMEDFLEQDTGARTSKRKKPPQPPTENTKGSGRWGRALAVLQHDINHVAGLGDVRHISGWIAKGIAHQR
jgi:hypothetical protein